MTARYDSSLLTTGGVAQSSPRAKRANQRQVDEDVQKLLDKPWRGQAENLRPDGKMVLAEFEEVGVLKEKLKDGALVKYAVTKYWVKWDGVSTAKYLEKLIITRLVETLLKSPKCPIEIKLKIANKLNNGSCKAFVRDHAERHPRCRELNKSKSSSAYLFACSFMYVYLLACTQACRPRGDGSAAEHAQAGQARW